MTVKITIVDYQMGNLRSVQKALEHVGAQAEISSDPDVIRTAEKLILPGVGGFGEAISELRKRDLDQPIIELVRSGKPFLGICLGLQLLFEVGFEGGQHHGLGLIEGSVNRFSGAQYDAGAEFKVPHMGWNQVSVSQANCPLFQGLSESNYFYFVHSYFVEPQDPNVVWLECDYGQTFCAAIWRDNVFATQFHPEKSQASGLKLLKNFAEL
ncbi:MAG: imidazole glycerol phosphate synthase subunit HisH [Pirellulales bacterium]